MRVTVTARHCEVSPELRALTRERVSRLARLAGRPHGAQVVFSDDHGVSAVELRLHTSRGAVLVGRGSARAHRSALDQAMARVRRQLDKTPRHNGRPTRRRTTAREGR